MNEAGAPEGMTWIPGGTFLMGSTKDTDPDRDDDEDDGAGHQIEVTIPGPFAVSRFEVTSYAPSAAMQPITANRELTSATMEKHKILMTMLIRPA